VVGHVDAHRLELCLELASRGCLLPLDYPSLPMLRGDHRAPPKSSRTNSQVRKHGLLVQSVHAA